MAELGVELLTPEAALLEGAATGVVLRTSEGDLTVLAGHTDLVGDVVPGVVRVQHEDGTDAVFVVHGGFLQVRTAPDAAAGLLAGDPGERTTRVTVLAGVAESLGEIDQPRAQAARDRAQAAIAALPPEPADEQAMAERASLETALARAELRLTAVEARAGS
jgi:F-type H+-transporting ATPase subunit epsilon